MPRSFDKDRIQVAAFDLDGTIFDRGTLLCETRDAILRLSESGVETVISTGRHPFFLPEEIMAIPCFRYAIASNGGIIADIRSHETLRVVEMDVACTRTFARTLCACTDKLHIVFQDGGMITQQDVDMLLEAYPTRARKADCLRSLRRMYDIVPDAQTLMKRIDRPAVKFGCRFRGASSVDAACAMLRETLDAEVVVTDSDMVEISPRGVSKGAGLEILCAHLGSTPENAVVFGDSGNDAAIMRRAGYCVAMGNASDDIREIADYVTDTVQNAGVAKSIRHLFNL
ncbi:MAG: HAD family hydrolase [Oscillospiraceae bacterium]|nr:HAD family hydrolase [Oscillospiraceae bacterium]